MNRYIGYKEGDIIVHPKVYIVQEPLRRDHTTGSMKRFMDFTPAAIYGELTPVLSSNTSVLTTGPLVNELRRKLSGITRDDYLLLVGDTVAIGLAVAVALEYTGGSINMLKWIRASSSYIKLTAEV
jgi:hypothetical protein